MSIRENQAYQSIVAELREKYEARGRMVAQLLREKDRAGILERARRVRSTLRAQLEDPALRPGPAEAEHLGTLLLPGYRIEKLFLRGARGLRIPVNLYLPRGGMPPFPAMIVPLGHWQEAKARPDNQIFCANLACRGVAAITYDPLFQGERCPYDPEDFSRLFGEASEDMWVVAMHMRAGNLAYMLDQNLGALFLAEARLVLDYLCARDDIDAQRVGAAGQSGGGTQSCYLAALDERISFYAPVQCISRLSVTLEDGIGDCEQSLLRSSAAEGLEQCDLMWAALPKPVLHSASLHDFFAIEGARDVARELSRVYDALDMGERYEFRTADCGHAFTREAREALYAWIGAQLGLCAPAGEIPIQPQAFEVLRCLPARDKNPMCVYRRRLREITRSRPSEPDALRSALRALVSAWAGGAAAVRPIGKNTFEVSVHPGRWARCVLEPRPGAPLVIVAGAQKTPLDTRAAILYSFPWGLSSAREKQTRGYDTETCLFNASGVLGQNLAAQRARELLAAADCAMRRCGASRCTLVGMGADAFPALLAACLEPRLSHPVLCGCLLSQDALFDTPDYFLRETEILPGLAALADLPALYRLCGAYLVDPLAPDGSALDAARACGQFGVRAANTGAQGASREELIGQFVREGWQHDDFD